MAEEVVTEEDFIQKQKKERKELQAQILTLKKSICKGDKKKKREVTEEIARLESDLDKRHDEELAAFKLSKVSIEETAGNDEPATSQEVGTEENKLETTQKMSKAQKRRDKKANAERERNQRIIEQEVENVFGKRNVETQAIKKILKERDLMIHEIPSDGHCLYNAVAHQLKAIGGQQLELKDLRMKTAAHLRANMNDFLPFLSNPDSDEMLSPEQYEKYCRDIADTTVWGGAVELQVLSHIIKCPIEVIQAMGTPYVVGEEYKNGKMVTVTYHRHMYELGAHYNSVTKFIKEDS